MLKLMLFILIFLYIPAEHLSIFSYLRIRTLMMLTFYPSLYIITLMFGPSLETGTQVNTGGICSFETFSHYLLILALFTCVVSDEGIVLDEGKRLYRLVQLGQLLLEEFFV